MMPVRHKVAVVWRGDRAAREAATPGNNRFHRIFEALAAAGIEAEPAVYDEAFVEDVRQQLLGVDGVLVWVNPLQDGKTRAALDPMLRVVAEHGPWVSAHPDVILKMGVKEVLHRTRHLGWGADTQLYRTAEAFRHEFPAQLQAGMPRVLKQNRGNDGQGVWKRQARCGASYAAGTPKTCHSRTANHRSHPSAGETQLPNSNNWPAAKIKSDVFGRNFSPDLGADNCRSMTSQSCKFLD